MARTDTQRWLDWRSNGGAPLRPRRTCLGCGDWFMPMVDRQPMCPPCIQVEIERRRRVADQAEIERAELELEDADRGDANRVRARRAESVREKIDPPPRNRVHARTVNERSSFHPKKTNKRAGGRSNAASWAFLAHRKSKSGWSDRKIAKFLGLPLREVRAVLAADPAQHANSGSEGPA